MAEYLKSFSEYKTSSKIVIRRWKWFLLQSRNAFHVDLVKCTLVSRDCITFCKYINVASYVPWKLNQILLCYTLHPIQPVFCAPHPHPVQMYIHRPSYYLMQQFTHRQIYNKIMMKEFKTDNNS